MTLRDQIELSLGNLWRVKLRTVLTVAGVVIAIAAFVALLSFGAGNQEFIAKQYREFGLFTTLDVFPREVSDADTVTPVPLDNATLARLDSIPGVNAAFPFRSFDVSAHVLDTQISCQARVLTEGALKSKLFTRIMGGNRFSSDSAREVVVTDELARLLDIDNADSLIGQTLIISTQVISLDSAIINVVDVDGTHIVKRLKEIQYDSLFRPAYRNRVMRRELSEALKRFVDGLMTRRITVSDTLTITGVAYRSGGINTAPLLITDETARRLQSRGMAIGSNPMDMLAAVQAGTFFMPEAAANSRHYPRITLDLDPYASVAAIKDSVEALGYKVTSYAEQFEQIQRFFIFFNVGLGVIGLIALVTAALGIVNTMVMSIIERRREIGVIKALGADERHIRRVFIVESGTIGALGSVVGLLVGWGGTRLIAFAAHLYMERQHLPPFDPFALPVWLILLTLTFGIGVATLAGLYPAARAARVDPVEALRGE